MKSSNDKNSSGRGMVEDLGDRFNKRNMLVRHPEAIRCNNTRKRGSMSAVSYQLTRFCVLSYVDKTFAPDMSLYRHSASYTEGHIFVDVPLEICEEAR